MDPTDQERMPLSSYELILSLDRLIPPVCIQPGQSLEDAHRYAGSRQLVDDLMAWMEAEMDEDLEEQRRAPERGSEGSHV